jgi:Protein of unknown function (DUF3489)
VVAATNAAEPKEIPMPTPKSKRQTPLRANSSKTTGRYSAARTTAGKTAKLKPGKQIALVQRHLSLAPQTRRAESKQARVIAMLRAPSGATIDAMVHATGWQQHSVRGFLAAVVRKKLGLNLVSATGERGRVYRIMDRTALPVSAAKTSHAA